jgi:hypothetical protein
MDGSGRGMRLNRGRGGCPTEIQRRYPKNRRPNRIPDGVGRGQGGEGRGFGLGNGYRRRIIEEEDESKESN